MGRDAILNAALGYAQAGYRVVLLHGIDPVTGRCTCRKVHCMNAGKHPRLTDWPSKATRDAATLRRLFAAHPHSNVGVMPKPGTVVVDVDPRNGGDASALNLPARTPTQRTGGGGSHHIVTVADPETLPKIRGVDYRYPGKHQIVVAPSVHASGNAYAWESGRSFDLTPAKWRPPVAIAKAENDETGGLAPMPTARPPHLAIDRLRALGLAVHALSPNRWGDGQHEAWLYEWVMPVHYETMGSEEGLALAHEVSAHFARYQAKVLNEKWASLEYPPTGAVRTGATLERVVQGLLAPAAKSHRAGSLPVVALAEFARNAAPPQWLVRRWLPTGALAVLLGETNSGKSAVSVALAMCIAAGRTDFCGQPVRASGAVVYIVAEGQQGMASRARIYMEKVLRLPPDTQIPLFFIPVAVSLSVESEPERIAKACFGALHAWSTEQDVPPPEVLLVVIDTLARNIGGDAHESDNADMSRVMNNCAELQRLLAYEGRPPAILLNAHPGHGEKGRVRGAYAVPAAADVILLLEAGRGNVALDPEQEDIQALLGGPVAVGAPRTLRVTKARDSAPPAPLQLRLMQDAPAWLRDPDTGDCDSTVYLAQHAELSPLSPLAREREATDGQVLAAIRDHGASTSVAALAKERHGPLPISKAALQKRLARLEQQGFVKRGATGGYQLTAKGAGAC